MPPMVWSICILGVTYFSVSNIFIVGSAIMFIPVCVAHIYAHECDIESCTKFPLYSVRYWNRIVRIVIMKLKHHNSFIEA